VIEYRPNRRQRYTVWDQRLIVLFTDDPWHAANVHARVCGCADVPIEIRRLLFR
jgi:hypothetical protein